MILHLRSALTADGAILGREARVVMDSGAYSIGTPLLGGVAAMLAPGPYRIPNIAVEVLSVYTNKMPFAAYRGPTGPQTIFAVETHMDEIARELGIDRVALRLRNAFADEDSGHSGQPLQRVSLKEAIQRAAEAIRIDEPSETSDPNLVRGKGLACAWWLTTAGAAGCGVQLNEDGTVVVQLGASEIGTGSVMAGIAQVVAEELRVPMDTIRIVWGDTDATPFDAGAQGSRTLFNAGRAAQAAAQDARQQLLQRAADMLEAAPEDLEVENGLVRVRGVPDRGVSYADLMAGQMWLTGPVLGRGTFLATPPDFDTSTFQGTIFTAFNAPSFHCHAAEVEIDRETGHTRVVDYVAVQDVGFAVNPTLVEGQMQGGAVQGIGYALTEELVIDEGRLLNPNLALYKLPTTLEAPNIRTVILEYASEEGPYGAKGVGEPPVILPAGAISCAIADAIGAPIRTTPFSPERVRQVIQEGEASATPDLPPSFSRRTQPARR
jgi:CO/xanthine dehydrogenase Mo-binding subunit